MIPLTQLTVTLKWTMNNRSARIIVCISMLESEASKIYSPGVCQEQDCVSTSMRGFTDRLQPSVAAPPLQDKAQLKEVQWKTTKGCVDLWGKLNLWTSTKCRGGGMSHQGIFSFVYLSSTLGTFPGTAAGRCKPGSHNKGERGDTVNVFVLQQNTQRVVCRVRGLCCAFKTGVEGRELNSFDLRIHESLKACVYVRLCN